MTTDDPNAPEASSPWPRWVRRAILPFVENAGLWPVTAAILGHVALVFALALLGALREAHPGSILGLAIFLGGSGRVVAEEWRRVKRPRGLSLLVLLTWVVAGLIAHFGHTSGAL